MKPNFCVITTTYQRPERIMRCVESVQSQTYANWTQIIVIDDQFSDYYKLQSFCQNNTRFTILKNKINMGKNASVNTALGYLRNKNFKGYIVYLDDDDWLESSCLQDFADKIHMGAKKWLVSQRVSASTGIPFVTNKTGKNTISYPIDNLLKKRFQGDVTHCIDFTSVKNIVFSSRIKNAEEWLYFAQVAKKIPLFDYYEMVGTYSDGYTNHGLTNKYHERKEYRKNTLMLWREILEERKGSLAIFIYMLLRSLVSITK